MLARIRALGLPPAWRDVWVAADPGAKVRATGVDRAGRTQYRYSAEWTRSRAAEKPSTAAWRRMTDLTRGTIEPGAPSQEPAHGRASARRPKWTLDPRMKTAGYGARQTRLRPVCLAW